MSKLNVKRDWVFLAPGTVLQHTDYYRSIFTKEDPWTPTILIGDRVLSEKQYKRRCFNSPLFRLIRDVGQAVECWRFKIDNV